MKKIKCNIIICGPAIGKTYLAQHDSRFVDVDAMKADYKYNLYNLSNEEKERGKLNRGEVVNKDSSKYAINLLENTIKEDRVALLSYNKKVIEYIIENKYEYCLVYADKNLIEEYTLRMKNRGNDPIFIERLTNEEHWNEVYENSINDKNATFKIMLKKGEYLSDIKDIFL